MLDWRIETRHTERRVLLGCDACDACVDLSTDSPGFMDTLSGFLEGHSCCARAVPAARPASA